jgi:hypothetical protein
MMAPERLQRMEEELSKQGIPSSLYAPLLYRWAWRLGCNITPPLFASFVTNLLTIGAFFGLLWGGFLGVLVWAHPGLSPGCALFGAIAIGLAAGTWMAFTYRYIAKRCRLPAWKDYGA